MRFRSSHLFALGLSFTALSTALPAQRWSERLTLSERRRAGIAYDEQRDRVLLFGGTQSRASVWNTGLLRETWEWDGLAWTRRANIPGEPFASDSTRGMVYDTANKRVLLVNANSSSLVTDFSRWEGRSWVAINVNPRPSFRQHFAVAYDEARNRVVLWGGSDQNGPVPDVWEFDGTAWTQIAAPGPGGRNDHALVWDGVRGRVVMFGGRDVVTATPLADMWEWNGTAWTSITPAAVPPARNQHSMTWDPVRRRVVLFGGSTGLPGTAFADTWEWDGTSWARITTANAPSARAGHGATYHSGRQRLVIACGETATDLRADTWEYDGRDWVLATAPESPSKRSDHVMCYDSRRGQMVLFGGRNPLAQTLGDMWLWQASRWTLAGPMPSPAARYDAAMVFDDARNDAVLFGGMTAGGAQNDTWLWDGARWTLASPAARPAARYGHAMAWDSARGRVVLFGGANTTGALLNDTWEWDGVNWHQVSPALSPPARADHGMAFDIGRNQMLVVGGRTTATTFTSDVWSYDGATTWTNRTPTPNAFTVRGNLGFAYDPIRGLCYALAGMSSAATYLNTTLNWNGTTWGFFFGIGPPARAGHSLVWDGSGRRMLLFGGESSGALRRSDTWVLSFNAVAQISPPIAAPGCAGPSGAAAISGFGSPALGNASFALDLTVPSPPTSAPVAFFLATSQGSAMLGSCRLVVDPATVFYTDHRVQRGPFASLRLPIPNVFSLMGATVFAQCAYLDPPTQLQGLAFSSGTQITIGDY